MSQAWSTCTRGAWGLRSSGRVAHDGLAQGACDGWGYVSIRLITNKRLCLWWVFISVRLIIYGAPMQLKSPGARAVEGDVPSHEGTDEGGLCSICWSVSSSRGEDVSEDILDLCPLRTQGALTLASERIPTPGSLRH